MLHDLDLDHKNLHINELIFLQNPKNPIVGVFLGIVPKLRCFPQNPAPSVLTLKKSWEPFSSTGGGPIT